MWKSKNSIESAHRKNAAEERRKTYLAIENIVAARPRGVEMLGARIEEILKYSQLSRLAVESAMRHLTRFGVIEQITYSRWRVRDLPHGFCWWHGVKHLKDGQCSVCKEEQNAYIKSEDW